MRSGHLAIAGALVTAVTFGGRATAVEPQQQAQLVSTLAPVLPTLKFSGTTTGEGSLKASVDFRWDVAESMSLTFAPTVSLSSTSAVASWTTVDSQPVAPSSAQVVAPEGNAWNVGLLFATTVLGDIRDPRLSSREFYASGNRALVDAVKTCVPICENAGLAGADKEFCDAYKKKGLNAPEAPSDFDPGELCSAGRQVYQDYEKKQLPKDMQRKQRDSKFRFPKLDLSAWGGTGTSKFKFFGPTSGQGGTGAATSYAEMSDTRWHAAGAAQAVYVAQGDQPFRLTVEVPATVEHKWKASKEIAQACVPTGTLQSNGAQILDCKSEALGAPTSTWVTSVGVYIGVADAQQGVWRAAVGGTWARDLRNNTNTWSISVPARISFVNFGKDRGFTPDFNGIVALAPTLQVTQAPEKPTDLKFFLVLQVLAQRTLFSHADDLLQ